MAQERVDWEGYVEYPLLLFALAQGGPQPMLLHRGGGGAWEEVPRGGGRGRKRRQTEEDRAQKAGTGRLRAMFGIFFSAVPRANRAAFLGARPSYLPLPVAVRPDLLVDSGGCKCSALQTDTHRHRNRLRFSAAMLLGSRY